MLDDKNIVIIANPDAQSGHAREVSLNVEDMFVKKFGEQRVTLKFVEGLKNVERAVKDLPSSVDVVIGLGGGRSFALYSTGLDEDR